MSLMTLAPAATGEQDPYYAGRADAYDDQSDGLTVPEMAIRASLCADLHPNVAYVMGYTDRLLEIRSENAAVAAAETELAYTPLPAGAR